LSSRARYAKQIP